MLASAPFDDWWHNAYGLDVKIVSPPHMVLAAGFFGIELGAVMLLLAFMNRATRRCARAPCSGCSSTSAARSLCESLLLKLEYIDRSDMHSGLFYIVVMLGTAAMLPALALASRHPWGVHDRVAASTRRSVWRFSGFCRSCPPNRSSGPCTSR